MAGRGPAPKQPAERRRTNRPQAGEWRHAPRGGWQHGEHPAPPAKLLKTSRETWETWLGAWFAGFWVPDDLPALRQVIRLYDEVERGNLKVYSQLRLAMDNYGITPKGQQERRWLPPEEEPGEARANGGVASVRRLRAVDPTASGE